MREDVRLVPQPCPHHTHCCCVWTHLPREDGKPAEEAQGVFRAPGSLPTPTPNQFVWGRPRLSL